MQQNKSYSYDVAFSYAGEQRAYVYNLFQLLKQRGLKVFYDEGQIAQLWGKDLYQYLTDIYQNKARYCIVFLSKEYANKLWTRHELKAVQARAFKEAEEYLLPIRFDSTEIPGLLPTIAYVNSADYTIEAIAEFICEKISEYIPFKENIKSDVDNDLEVALADAVICADEYLKPQSLDLSEPIVESVRNSFIASKITPVAQILKPYLINEKPSFRVVGYLAYQIKPFASSEIALTFITCFRKEQKEAQDKKETRPLWQLLVCVQSFLSISESSNGIVEKLKETLSFLENDSSIDPGGECKERIRHLIRFY